MNNDKAFFQNLRVFNRANVGLASEGGSGVPKHLKVIHRKTSLGVIEKVEHVYTPALFYTLYHGEMT
jgi:hypothetical protein